MDIKMTCFFWLMLKQIPVQEITQSKSFLPFWLLFGPFWHLLARAYSLISGGPSWTSKWPASSTAVQNRIVWKLDVFSLCPFEVEFFWSDFWRKVGKHYEVSFTIEKNVSRILDDKPANCRIVKDFCGHLRIGGVNFAHIVSLNFS